MYLILSHVLLPFCRCILVNTSSLCPHSILSLFRESRFHILIPLSKSCNLISTQTLLFTCQTEIIRTTLLIHNHSLCSNLLTHLSLRGKHFCYSLSRPCFLCHNPAIACGDRRLPHLPVHCQQYVNASYFN